MVIRYISIFAVTSAVFCANGARVQCRAAVTLLGPTPYYSRADSPFPVDGSNPNFFLEDFEPPPNLPPGGLVIGKFSPYGATREWGSIQRGFSIGQDDRVDGTGHNSWAGAPNVRILTGTESQLDMFNVDFDAQSLGFFPTAVGFVVTHGGSENCAFSIYSPAGGRKDYSFPSLNLSDIAPGGGDFVGVVDNEGISRIEILQSIDYSTPTENLLFDHFQYGLFVPEPTSAAFCILAHVVAAISLFSRHLRLSRFS